MNFDAVPIACADEDWMDSEFIPWAKNALKGNEFGVWLMPSDAAVESNYLLGQLKKQAESRQTKWREINLSPEDPTIDWSIILGSADNKGLFSTKVTFVKNGNYLPFWVVEEHLEEVDRICKSVGSKLFLPICREVAAQLDMNKYSCFALPQLRNANGDDRLKLFCWLIDKELPEISRSNTRNELAKLLWLSDPLSRQCVSSFLRHVGDAIQKEEFFDYLEAARSNVDSLVSKEPAQVKHVSALESKYFRLLNNLNGQCAPFEAATKQQLFRPNHELQNPFASGDPFFWFLVVVSNLSCIFFDAAKGRGLSVLPKFRFDRTLNDIVANDNVVDFVNSLRSIRTYFQHGLDPEGQDDRKTLQVAMEWLQISVQDGQKYRYLARDGLFRILGELDELLMQIIPIVENIKHVPTGYMVTQELLRSQRIVADHELYRAVEKVIKKSGVNLEAADFYRRNESIIRSDLSKSNCNLENLHEELELIVESFCAKEITRMPSVSDVLVKAGLKNRELGIAQKSLEQAWESIPTMTLEDLKKLANKEAAQILEQRK